MGTYHHRIETPLTDEKEVRRKLKETFPKTKFTIDQYKGNVRISYKQSEALAPHKVIKAIL